MAQASKVKQALERAATAKVIGASASEATGTVTTWNTVVNDPEATPDLRSAGVFFRDALAAAVIRGDANGQQAALASLAGLTVKFS